MEARIMNRAGADLHVVGATVVYKTLPEMVMAATEGLDLSEAGIKDATAVIKAAEMWKANPEALEVYVAGLNAISRR